MNRKHTSTFFLIVCMLVLAPAAYAQSALRKANDHFEYYEYALAIEQYNKAIERQKPDLETTRRLAEAYRLTRRTKEAENWYAKVVAMPGREPINLYYYAEMLRSNGKYDEAKAQYQRWASEAPDMSAKAQALAQTSDLGKQWVKQQPVASVTKEQRISTANYSDFSPMPFGDGIIITSDRGLGSDKKTEVYGWTGRPYLQLFTTSKDGQGNWGKPVALQDVINSQYHNATASSNEGGQSLYFTRVHVAGKQASENPADPTSWINKSAKNKKLVNRLEIYIAQKQGGTWTNIQPFVYNKVEEYSVGHPALSPDGQTLYFTSDMPGGLGETDIYYSKRHADGSWGKPVNAGSTINTSGRESFPYVDRNGKLFFASEGHVGMGGLDIFSAEGAHGSWSSVKNLGYPINTPQNDYGIMFDKVGESGLLSSNRDAADGTDDIYSFKMLRKPVVFAITTIENVQQNAQASVAQVRVAMVQQNQTDTTVFTTNADGRYFINGLSGSTYSFMSKRNGYSQQPYITQIPTDAGDTVQVVLTLNKQMDAAGNLSGIGNRSGIGTSFTGNGANGPFTLRYIYYDLDKSRIRGDAEAVLDEVAVVLNENTNIILEITGHADSRGTRKYNQKLSERRARSAVNYLVSKGISRNRLRARGYGETKLVNECKDTVKCTEELHQQNRRTEFMVID